jgi:Immunity protein family (Imm11)
MRGSSAWRPRVSDPYWVWANEPTRDDEAMIYGVPPIIERLRLLFNQGQPVISSVPLIEIERDSDSQGVLTDNLIAAGVKGLLFSSRLRELLRASGVENIEYFPTVIRNPADGTETQDYSIANVLGLIACLDRAKSVVEHPPGDPDYIEFIEKLALDGTRIRGADFFRLAEKSQILIASERVKRACEAAKITGVRFYAPQDYKF